MEDERVGLLLPAVSSDQAHATYPVPRPYGGKHGGAAMGSPPLQRASVVPQIISAPNNSEDRYDATCSKASQRRPRMVDETILSKGKHLPRVTEEYLITDASLSRRGGVWNHQTVQGRWSAEDARLPIDLLELREFVTATFRNGVAGATRPDSDE